MVDETRDNTLTEAQRNYQQSLVRENGKLSTQRNAEAAAGRQSAYDFTYRAFPSDLGQNYQGHYMVININVPVRAFSGQQSSLLGNISLLGDSDLSRVDRLRRLDGAGSGQSAGLSSILPRYTKRIKESVALYMPNTLNYTTQNIYEDISLTALAGNLGVWALARGASNRARQAGSVRRAREVATNILSAAGSASTVVGKVTSLLQSPINPAIEVLFSNTLQRQFVFEILLAPRNEKESETIKEIIKTLRFHSAPEVGNAETLAVIGPVTGVAGNLAASFFWIPPAEFDITFFKDGVENTNIPRINTCVLERIEADYTPTGIYSTFGNGHPVAVRLSLGFRELEPIHKARVLQGF